MANKPTAASNKDHILNTPLGERGDLGNPYPAGDSIQELYECIRAFELTLRDELQNRDNLADYLNQIAGAKLMCWCQTFDTHEDACHGEIVAAYAATLRTTGTIPDNPLTDEWDVTDNAIKRDNTTPIRHLVGANWEDGDIYIGRN